MISSVTLRVGTGNDDLREGSQVWVRLHVQGSASPYLVKEIARGQRFPDRTMFSEVWPLPTPIAAEDIEHVEITFIPDPGQGPTEGDDQWVLLSFALGI